MTVDVTASSSQATRSERLRESRILTRELITEVADAPTWGKVSVWKESAADRKECYSSPDAQTLAMERERERERDSGWLTASLRSCLELTHTPGAAHSATGVQQPSGLIILAPAAGLHCRSNSICPRAVTSPAAPTPTHTLVSYVILFIY